MNDFFNRNLPDVASLKQRAKKRIPHFAFDYLEGGCNEEIGIERNRLDIQSIQLRSELLKPFSGTSLETEIFGHTYSCLLYTSPSPRDRG